MSLYPSVRAVIEDVRERLSGRPALADAFAKCFPNTLDTTMRLLPDGTTFVFTGDIPAMWLRDSSAQVHPYLPLAASDEDLRRMFRGLIRRQALCVVTDPYANAFNETPSGAGHRDEPPKHPLVWERKYELDSLCYPIRLLHGYWAATGDDSVLDEDALAMLRAAIGVMRVEQRHESSPYWFLRPLKEGTADTLRGGPRGNPVGFTGMIWSGFRPSDDGCQYGYLVPANMMAVVALRNAADLLRGPLPDAVLAAEADALAGEVEAGIERFGTVEHPRFGRVYAYEVDGLGNHLLMDDANVPSLLSIPYLGYRPASDETYRNTRALVLSEENPYYFAGR